MSDLKPMASAAGAHVLTAKVSKIEEKQGSKGSYYLVWLDGYASRLYSKEKPSFAEGYEGPVNIEAKDGDQGLNFFLGKPKAAGGFGGGGRPASAPKSKEEIHSASICGVIKSCLEREKSVKEAQEWVDLYLENIKRVAG